MSKSSASAYKWSSIDRLINSAMTFAGNIVLARLLSPDDFGLLAMVAIFTAIGQNLSSCGLSEGLIQKARPSERDYSTVFVYNAIAGLILCAIFAALAHPIASYFKHPQLVDIMYVLGVCLLCQTLAFTQETRLRKELDFKRLAIVRLSSTLCANLLGIALALYGWGYWGLVSTHGFLSVFQLIFYLLVTRWIPRIAFYKDSFKHLFMYGFKLVFAYFAIMIGRYLSPTVLGKYAPAAAAGVFSQAQKLEEVPFAILESIFNWPFFSILSNETDRAKRVELAANMHQNLVFLNMTIASALMLVAAPAIIFLYGDKWVEAIPIFRILLVFGVAVAIKAFYQTVLKSYAYTGTIAVLSYVEVAIQISLLLWSYDKGIVWIALSQLPGAIICLLIYAGYYRHIQRCSVFQVVKQWVLPSIAPLVAFAGTYMIDMCVAPYLRWSIVQCAEIGIVYTSLLVAILEVTRPSYYKGLRAQLISRFKSKK